MKRENIFKIFDWLSHLIEINPNKTIRASRRDFGNKTSHYRWLEVSQ